MYCVQSSTLGPRGEGGEVSERPCPPGAASLGTETPPLNTLDNTFELTTLKILA